MDINAKEIITNTRRFLVFLIVNICRSACEHPFLLGVFFFLLLLYRCLPYLFGFLVSSSPVVICTALLLGTLLSYGQPNIPEVEDKAINLSSSQVLDTPNGIVLGKDVDFSLEGHIETREKVEETAAKEVKSSLKVYRACKPAFLSESNEEEERNPENVISTSSLAEVDKKQVCIMNTAADKEEGSNGGFFKKSELHGGNSLPDSIELADLVYPATISQKENEYVKTEIQESSAEGYFDSSLDLSWGHIDRHDASESDSDHAESSSPDASMADIIPMLYELHPLLDSEDPQPVNASANDVHSASGASMEDSESDDCSGEEEAENQEEELDEEAKDENGDGAVLAVRWTEDDEKNVMVLGTSELERNQRLENLIAKRRARKNLQIAAEKNLIDLDGNETVSTIDKLSHIQVQVPLISTSRQNPFDLPYDCEENFGLHPIPGSAPSVLLPRQNPFDSPQALGDESGNFTGVPLNHQGFAGFPQRELLFRRHESFAHGTSFSGEFRQDRSDIKLRPYFVSERTSTEDTSYAHFQRQLSDKSDSKVSSIPESESISSTNQDYENEPPEQELDQEAEFDLVFSSTNNAKTAGMENSSSDEADSVDSSGQLREIGLCGSYELHGSTAEVSGASINEAVDDFMKLEEKIQQEIDSCSPVSDAAESDVAEKKHNRPASSSQASGKYFQTKTEEESADLHEASGDSLRDSTRSLKSVSVEVKVVNDSVEPVYDLSPSAIEKSPGDIASFGEEFLQVGSGSFKSALPLSSESPVETLEMNSLPIQAKGTSSKAGDSLSDSVSTRALNLADGPLWVPPSNLASVEENESRSKEVGEIKEQDVIQVEFSEGKDEYEYLTASALSEPAIEQIMSCSSSTSAESDTTEDSELDEEVNHQFTEQGKVAFVEPYPDVLVSSDCFAFEVSPIAYPSQESSTVQASVGTPLVQSLFKTLSSIPEDPPEYYAQGNKHENVSLSGINAELIDSRKFEMPTANLPHVDESSLLDEEPKTLDNDVIDALCQGEEVKLPIMPEKTEMHETTLSSTSSSDLSEHKIVSNASGSVHDPSVATRRVDDEALLLELDSIGDFHVKELRLSDIRNDKSYQVDFSEEPSQKPEDWKSEGRLAEIRLETTEKCRSSPKGQTTSLEGTYMDLSYVSDGTSTSPSNLKEAKSASSQQEAAESSLEAVHAQAFKAAFVGSPKALETTDIFHLQGVGPGPLPDVDMALNDFSETGYKFDSSNTEATSISINGFPKEETAIKRNLNPSVLEVPSSMEIDLAGADGATDIDASTAPIVKRSMSDDGVGQIPLPSGFSSSASTSKEKDESHESDSSSSSSDSD
ncbi:unnamed protein product [Spirodela intermedia]|uniref:Uncharacterized protein n=1 Tax=Spirodela intermedia TaxID=51605 RepID=A0A7I8KF97_SPIIN|nr:unnamed protein product [Spirodela intermedia]